MAPVFFFSNLFAPWKYGYESGTMSVLPIPTFTCDADLLVAVNGSLAEGMSMTLDERKRLAEEWMKASNGRLQVVVHVGANCIKDAKELVDIYVTQIQSLVLSAVSCW